MQVELGGDAVVQLGPTTNAMFQRSSTRGKTDQWVYVMDGWVKARGAQDGRIAADIRTPAVDVPGSPSTVVMRTSPGEVTLFVERGQVRLLERAAPKGGKADRGDPTVGATPDALNAGQLYQRKGGNARTVSTGGLAAFVQEMPRSFRDSLPMRSERFAGKDIKLREAPDPTYADLQAWLQAEPAVRKPMVKRFRAKVKEEPFRAALAANMRAHMEWDPILFPEKYLPKPASAPDAASAATAQRWRTP
jgi:hypothetical protein